MRVARLMLYAGSAGFFAVGGLLIWDRIPEVDPDPANGPVANIGFVSASQRPLTTEVRNPAGIAYVSDSQTYLVSTDDREFMEITSDFSKVISSMTLPVSPNSIGDTEGVAYLGNGEAVAIAENGVVVVLARHNDGWAEEIRFPIVGFEVGSLLGSATYDPTERILYTAQKTGGKRLYRIDLSEQTSTVVEMRLASHLSEKSERSWSEFTVAGLQFADGHLYGISEAFSSLLTISTAGTVEAIHGLKNINESSGITIRDGVLTLIGDAEGYLPDPPVYLFNKPAD